MMEGLLPLRAMGVHLHACGEMYECELELPQCVTDLEHPLIVVFWLKPECLGLCTCWGNSRKVTVFGACCFGPRRRRRRRHRRRAAAAGPLPPLV